jgi:hypothetical protein
VPSPGTVATTDDVADRLDNVLATWRAAHDERALRRALLALMPTSTDGPRIRDPRPTAVLAGARVREKIRSPQKSQPARGAPRRGTFEA